MIDQKNRRKLYQYVVEELGLRIAKGEFQPGDTLPNEDALCRQFDVSRGVLREATKVLSEKGLIKSRPKTGTRILPRRDWNVFDPDVLSWTYTTGDTFEFLRNITEIRRVVEAEAARMAAMRATEEDLAPIRQAYREMEDMVDDEGGFSAESFIQLDLQFHTAILDACHNELMAQLGRIMRQALLTGRQIDRPTTGDRQTSLQSHMAITEAIAEHDPERAYTAAQGHIDQVWGEIQKRRDQKKI